MLYLIVYAVTLGHDHAILGNLRAEDYWADKT